MNNITTTVDLLHFVTTVTKASKHYRFYTIMEGEKIRLRKNKEPVILSKKELEENNHSSRTGCRYR